MFKCGKCNKVQPRHTQPVMVVTATRPKTYPKRYVQDECVDEGGTGTETVQELPMCPQCAAQYIAA